MTLLRSTLPAVARLAALAVLTGHVALAGTMTCTMCAQVKHDCRPATLIAACCGGGNVDTAGPAVMVPAIRVAPPAVAVANPPHPTAPPASPLPLFGAPTTATPAGLIILIANLRV